MAYDTRAIDELQASLQEYIKQTRPQLAESARQKGEQEAKDREAPGWQKALLSAAIGYLTGGLGSALMGAVGPAAGAAVSAIPGGKAVVDATKAAVDAATGATKLAQPLADSANKVRSLIPVAGKYGLDQASLGTAISNMPRLALSTATGAPGAAPAASGGIVGAVQGGIGNLGKALAPNEENVWGAIKSGVKGYGARTPEEAVGVGLETGISNLDTLMAARKVARTRAASQATLEGAGYRGKGATIGEAGQIGTQTYENPNLTAKRLSTNEYLAKANTGKFSGTQTPGSVPFLNPSGQEEYYTPNPSKVPGGDRNRALGNLSQVGAKLYGIAQADIDAGKPQSEVIANINATTSVSAGEKAIIIKNIRTTKKRTT